MNEEVFNRTKRMFFKRIADNFWYDGQWKFYHTLKNTQKYSRDDMKKITQSLRGCVTRDTLPTAIMSRKLKDYFNEKELADIAEARIEQEIRLRKEKQQHMKILGTVRSGKRKRQTSLVIDPTEIFTLSNGNAAEFISKTDGGNFIFKEIRNYTTHLLTEQEAKIVVEGK